MCAEKNLETYKGTHGKTTHRKNTNFSAERKQAYVSQNWFCEEWHKAGRPSNPNHQAKAAKLKSQHRLQYIARNEEKLKTNEINDEEE